VFEQGMLPVKILSVN